MLVALWYLRYGGGSNRVRQWIVGLGLLALVAWLVTFRPGYNGGMGIYGRAGGFAVGAGGRLGEIAGTAEAVDWQTTPQDYPRFLGTGYWPEVPGVRLETDWIAHPPQEGWRGGGGGGGGGVGGGGGG